MTQAEHIVHQFSDAFLVTILESGDTNEVIRLYTSKYPELSERFTADARDLELMYGYMRSSEMPSESDISSAYHTVQERFPKAVVAESAARAAKVRSGFFATIRDNFKMKPIFAGASLGIGMAVILALLWHPWATENPQGGTTAQNQNTNLGQNEKLTNDLAVNTTPADQTNPTQNPTTTFRGTNGSQTMTSAEKHHQDSIDAVRMNQLASNNDLSAPKNLVLDELTKGAVLVRWSSSQNALGYIVEIKRANEDKFSSVSQTTQTRAHLQNLHSGEKVEIRIVPTSGERKGEASDAKSIIVP